MCQGEETSLPQMSSQPSGASCEPAWTLGSFQAAASINCPMLKLTAAQHPSQSPNPCAHKPKLPLHLRAVPGQPSTSLCRVSAAASSIPRAWVPTGQCSGLHEHQLCVLPPRPHTLQCGPGQRSEARAQPCVPSLPPLVTTLDTHTPPAVGTAWQWRAALSSCPPSRERAGSSPACASQPCTGCRLSPAHRSCGKRRSFLNGPYSRAGLPSPMPQLPARTQVAEEPVPCP